MRKLLLAATALLAVDANTEAQAAPDLSARIFEDGSLVSGTAVTSSTGTLFVSGVSTNFTFLSALSLGFPQITQPALDVQTTSISTIGSFSGTHTLTFEVTQTGLNSTSAGAPLAALASSFTANFLIGTSFVQSVSIASYVDAANTAFGTSQLLAANTYTSGPTNASGAIIASPSLPNSLFSETVVITATFTGGNALLNASAQIVAVPEPSSLVLFGMGLLGMSLMRRRNRQG